MSSSSSWSQEEFAALARADEIDVASRRPDGTLSRRVTVWVIPHQDQLYVRSWKGASARWFRAARARRAGRVWVDAIERDVAFEPLTPDADFESAIDAGYRAKYQRHGAEYVDAMVRAEARATTLKLVPR